MKLFLFGFVAGLLLLSGQNAFAHNKEKLTVCHKTHSETNPWVKQTINANELQSHLDNGDFLIEGDAVCPPIETTPTPTDVPSGTPTPTQTPCFVLDNELPVPCPTETPIASPTPTLEQPHDAGGGVGAIGDNSSHVTTCTASIDAPKLQGFKAEGNGQLTFSWWGVEGADHYSIRYGYKPDQLIFGVPNIPSSSTAITLGGLQKGKNVWAIVTVYKQDCAKDSNILDPIVK